MYDRIITPIDAANIATDLLDECDAPGFEAYACLEANAEGFVTGNQIQIVWYPEHKRAGLIYAGSGSSGATSWTDATSPEDALSRYLDDDMRP